MHKGGGTSMITVAVAIALLGALWPLMVLFTALTALRIEFVRTNVSVCSTVSYLHHCSFSR